MRPVLLFAIAGLLFARPALAQAGPEWTIEPAAYDASFAVVNLGGGGRVVLSLDRRPVQVRASGPTEGMSARGRAVVIGRGWLSTANVLEDAATQIADVRFGDELVCRGNLVRDLVAAGSVRAARLACEFEVQRSAF